MWTLEQVLRSAVAYKNFNLETKDVGVLRRISILNFHLLCWIAFGLA